MLVGSISRKLGPGWEERGEKRQFGVRDRLGQCRGRLRKNGISVDTMQPRLADVLVKRRLQEETVFEMASGQVWGCQRGPH